MSKTHNPQVSLIYHNTQLLEICRINHYKLIQRQHGGIYSNFIRLYPVYHLTSKKHIKTIEMF